MIWGCFIGNKLGPIAFIDSMVNSDRYINILDDHLLPYLDALTNDGITNIIFQQDNARPHVSDKTRTFLTTAATQHGFIVMDHWPPYSPDMNLIEHLWAHIKLELYRRYPDTATLRGSPSYIRQRITERVQEIWWSIGEEVPDSLINSMPDRVQALIKAKGRYTEY